MQGHKLAHITGVSPQLSFCMVNAFQTSHSDTKLNLNLNMVSLFHYGIPIILDKAKSQRRKKGVVRTREKVRGRKRRKKKVRDSK